MKPRASVTKLTERQQRELAYHRDHAARYVQKHPSASFDVIFSSERRWWNAYWEMFHHIRQLDLRGKKVLVVGCGFGKDAVRLALLGAEVFAFDLSVDSLQVAAEAASDARVSIQFQQMTAEQLDYDDGVFDLVLIVDVLHHCEIELCMREITRVAKAGCHIVISEIYSHTLLDRIRNSNLVKKVLYPRLVSFVYSGQAPYITADERKITEHDLRHVLTTIRASRVDYFYIFVKRVFPASFVRLAKLDRAIGVLLSPIGWLVAGRVIVTGRLGAEPQ